MYFTLFWLSFMSKIVPNFSNSLHMLKVVLGLLLTSWGDIVSVPKAKILWWNNLLDPEFKNMYFTLFRLSFMSEMVPNFSNFLHILKIVRELLLILFGGT